MSIACSFASVFTLCFVSHTDSLSSIGNPIPNHLLNPGISGLIPRFGCILRLTSPIPALTGPLIPNPGIGTSSHLPINMVPIFEHLITVNDDGPDFFRIHKENKTQNLKLGGIKDMKRE